MRIPRKLNKIVNANNGRRTNTEKRSHYSNNNTKTRTEKETVNNYKENLNIKGKNTRKRTVHRGK